jgi:cytochrome c
MPKTEFRVLFTSSCARAVVAIAVILPLSACKDDIPQISASAKAGEAVFGDHCAMCHQVDSSAHSQTAPSLKGVIGRKAGAVGFNFSPAFRKADFVWTPETMSRFLAEPRAVVPDNQMAFYGLDGPEMRSDLVAFLVHHSN